MLYYWVVLDRFKRSDKRVINGVKKKLSKLSVKKVACCATYDIKMNMESAIEAG